jgi:hypothetical protein
MWTAKDKAPTSISLATFLGALTKDGYMTDGDLRKVLTAPGVGPGKEGPFTAENIAFNFYEVSDASPPEQVFVATRNVSLPDEKMKEGVAPYGTELFVFFTKGGGGGFRSRPSEDHSTFPVGKAKNGAEFRYVTLK